MKNFSFLFIGLLFATSIFGQRFAFVNTDYILQQIPEYKNAQTELDKLSESYKKEIETMKKEVNTLMYTYQADKILLTPEMRDKREQEIKVKKETLEKLKTQRFGENGDLFLERQKLVKPIQDKVYEAIKDVADKGNYNLILDVSSNMAILYYDEKYDKTKDVLKKLGY